jgi:hypothetical protein
LIHIACHHITLPQSLKNQNINISVKRTLISLPEGGHGLPAGGEMSLKTMALVDGSVESFVGSPRAVL